jgi:hypothetical protein
MAGDERSVMLEMSVPCSGGFEPVELSLSRERENIATAESGLEKEMGRVRYKDKDREGQRETEADRRNERTAGERGSAPATPLYTGNSSLKVSWLPSLPFVMTKAPHANASNTLELTLPQGRVTWFASSITIFVEQ